jgi:hypothetical protein
MESQTMRRTRRSFTGHALPAELDDVNGTNSIENSLPSPVIRNGSGERSGSGGGSGLEVAIDASVANVTTTADSRSEMTEAGGEGDEEVSPAGGVAVDIA